MAIQTTKTLTYANALSKEGAIGTSWAYIYHMGHKNFENSTHTAQVRKYIPPYSTIDKVTMQVDNNKIQVIEQNKGNWHLDLIAKYKTKSTSGDTTYNTTNTKELKSFGRDGLLENGGIKENTSELQNLGLFKFTFSPTSGYGTSADFSSGTANAGLLRKNIEADIEYTDNWTECLYFSWNNGYIVGDPTANYFSGEAQIIYDISLPTLTISSENENYGIVSNSGTYNIDAGDIDKEVPALGSVFKVDCVANASENYRFLHWSDDEEKTNKIRTFTKTDLNSSDTEISAKFIPIYQVNINLDGGEFSEGSPYSNEGFQYDEFGIWDGEKSIPYADGFINVQKPSKDGYTFAGWENTKTYEITTENLTIQIASAQNFSYKALWTVNTYTIKVELDPNTDPNFGSLKIIYKNEEYDKIELEYGENNWFTLEAKPSSDKYKYTGIQKIVNNKVEETYPEDKNKYTIQNNGNYDNETEIIYKPMYEIKSYQIEIECFIYDEEKDEYITVVPTIDNPYTNYFDIEIGGQPHDSSSNSSSYYEYDFKADLVFVPKIQYDLFSWKAQFGPNTTSSSNILIEDVQFKRKNNIRIELKENDIMTKGNSIPSGTPSSDPLVKEITRSIINKNINRYVDNNKNSLEEIRPYAFYNCQNLKTFFVKQCNYIRENAFEGCEKLNLIILPQPKSEPYLDISQYAFKGCTNLSTIIIPGEKIPNLQDTKAFQGTFLDSNGDHYIGYIYVNNVEKYENDTNWCKLSGRFKEIPIEWGDFLNDLQG